jgi:predicted TPR repeat methyltransferase
MSSLEQARDLFLAGVAAYEAGRYAAAEQRFIAALGLAPGRPSVLVNLAATQIKLGRAAEAIESLQEAAAAETPGADALHHHATALAMLGRAAEALALNERAVALAPRHAAPLMLHGQLLQALGRPAEALAAYQTLLDADATHAAAWSQRGMILKDMGRLADAAQAFRQALAHGIADPALVELNRYLLASVAGGEGGQAVPARAPRVYVQGLFDSYAEGFDEHLTGKLGYRAPQRLHALLPAGRRYAAALDLGCGTGLMAPLLGPLCGALDGVDLSRPMLDKAHALGRYRQLVHGDMTEHLRTTGERYALVAAADVFVYVGALDAVFEGSARVLDAGGLFLFSVEESAAQDLELRPSSRYAHSQAHVRRLAPAHGFATRRIERATLRRDQGRPVAGLCCLLERRP